MLPHHAIRLLAATALLWLATPAAAAQPITVYAAASLTNAVSEIGAAYESRHGREIRSSFASSAALATQIENGAPADIYISADSKWMDYLQARRLIASASRMDLLGNRLVLIAPKGRPFKVRMDASFDFAAAFSGKLCTGESASVPVGIYARQALTALHWWEAIAPRIVGSQDVRAALAFVERGECGAGIVYATDAQLSHKVDVVAAFPDDSHAPIVYPAALVAGAPPAARDFLDYLRSSTAQAIFRKYGFTPIGR